MDSNRAKTTGSKRIWLILSLLGLFLIGLVVALFGENVIVNQGFIYGLFGFLFLGSTFLILQGEERTEYNKTDLFEAFVLIGLINVLRFSPIPQWREISSVILFLSIQLVLLGIRRSKIYWNRKKLQL